MGKIEGYGVYQNTYYENSVKNNRTKSAKDTDEAGKAAEKKQVELSDDAKDLLNELKKKYGNMDFIVADYDSEEEAASYLSRGRKEYSVLIEPELLEKMAADKDTKDKYIGIIEDAAGDLTEMKEQLGDKEDEVVNLGVTVDKDGNVSYFAELEKMGEKQRERIEKSRSEKKEEKADAEKAAEEKAADKALQERRKRTRVQADSIEELLEKINNVDWDDVKTEDYAQPGSRFDFSI